MLREKTWNLTLFLCGIWVITILYGEMFAYWVSSTWSCSWPNLRSSKINEVSDMGSFVKVAVIADPQLTDRTSLPLAPKSLASEMVQFYSDLYMRRAFLASVMAFEPDAIMFLGDYFDGGLILSNEEWKESLSRFKHIFNLNDGGTTKDKPVYYIPGNHDIGYAAHIFKQPEVVKRYEKEFGARNYEFTIGKVNFIAVDAQTIDGNSKRNMTSRTWDFLKNVSMDVGPNPRVLLTHIPLYRQDGTPCGPYRYSPVINQRIAHAASGREIIYQNYISEHSSNSLLNLIKPVLVLSGHDHDQCIVTHTTRDRTVKEHTVGTVSWQQGNLRPSFMLLSVSNVTHTEASMPDTVVSARLCFLPNQTFIYIWYIILFVTTVLALLLWPTNGIGLGHHISNFLGGMKDLSTSIFRGTKEKNDDEKCEYEMIWDAEGSMHLVKKPIKAPPSGSKDAASMERGNVVMRSSRRQTNQEQDLAMNIDVDSALDSTASMNISRLRKSRTVVVVQRVLRTIRMMVVIAVVNVPLYMMLLFKDWTD